MRKKILAGILFFCSSLVYSGPNRTELSVWVNEAIVATYTINYSTYLQDETAIAKYFTSEGWVAYSKALDASKLPEVIKQNTYEVTAVATTPPKIVTLDPTHWQAVMNILVLYENKKHQQKQQLKVSMVFTTAPKGQGVRGFSIISLQSKALDEPCRCPIQP